MLCRFSKHFMRDRGALTPNNNKVRILLAIELIERNCLKAAIKKTAVLNLLNISLPGFQKFAIICSKNG